MAVDVSQFLDTFYEESFEGLGSMEAELLALNVLQPNLESINTIFRAAHSIKGGSATFGLADIAEFTHVLETLLDQVRSQVRAISQSDINLLLKSVDCIRTMLTANRAKESYERSEIDAIRQEFVNLLGTGKNSPAATPVVTVNADSEREFQINFKPHGHLFKTGNNPVRMFAELESLGTICNEVNLHALPELDSYIVDECYLSWTILLSTKQSEHQIEEIFEWVSGDCDLDIVSHDEKIVQEATPALVLKSEVGNTVADASADALNTNQIKKTSESNSIRVGIDKVDALINMVGELVITQSMLGQLGKSFDLSRLDKLRDGLSQLARNTRELQENVMRIRMLPMSFAFNRFPRLVHDLGQKLGKKIRLSMLGEQTEVDKTVLEKIVDPLVHLVRNSIDHGIEKPDIRHRDGKAETGVITLNAFHKGGNIVIEVSDDGAGLDRTRILKKARERNIVAENQSLSDAEINDLIFAPGFSTADIVSDVSGRGVGMDVVRRNVHELSGQVEITTQPGQGSKFTIRLPLTLAIMDGQLIRIGSEIYIVPLVSIVESLQAKSESINRITGKAELYQLRSEYIEILRLYKVFGVAADREQLENGLLVVVEAEGKKVGLLVDELLDQQQVVIKSLDTNYGKIEGVSGATILGDGRVAMIIDILGLIKLAHFGAVKKSTQAEVVARVA